MKSDFFKNKLTDIKHFKNNCIVKYKMIKNKKTNGQKVSLIDFFIEIGILKKKKINNNKNQINSSFTINSKKEEEKINTKKLSLKKLKKLIINTSSVFGFILVSFLISCIFFEESNTINYLKLTNENETKILNTLKSPKTNICIKNTYNKKTDTVDYYFLVVDNLDSYSYKIKLNDTYQDLHNELFQGNLKNTKNIQSLNKITINTVVSYENLYLINNKYNIDKSLINNNTLNKIENQIKANSITKYNNIRNLTVSITTIILTLLFNFFYFNIKKVISKK